MANAYESTDLENVKKAIDEIKEENVKEELLKVIKAEKVKKVDEEILKIVKEEGFAESVSTRIKSEIYSEV